MPIIKETKSASWTSQIAIEKARELNRDAELELAKTSRDGITKEIEWREALLEELVDADEGVGAHVYESIKVAADNSAFSEFTFVQQNHLCIDPVSVEQGYGWGLKNGVGYHSGGYKSCFIDLDTRTLHAAGEAGAATRGYLRGFCEALADNCGLTLDIRRSEHD